MTGGSAAGSNAGGCVAIGGDIGAAAGGSVRVLSGHGTSNASGDVSVDSSSSGGQSVRGAVRVESGSKTWWFIHLEEESCIHVLFCEYIININIKTTRSLFDCGVWGNILVL